MLPLYYTCSNHRLVVFPIADSRIFQFFAADIASIHPIALAIARPFSVLISA